MSNDESLITGINGQDGSYLAELLLEKGYEVHGIIRRSSTFNTQRIEHLYIDSLIQDLHKDRKINLHYGDMTDSTNLIRLVESVISFSELYCPNHIIASCTVYCEIPSNDLNVRTLPFERSSARLTDASCIPVIHASINQEAASWVSGRL